MTELYDIVLKFATESHGEQKRKYTGEPYITHPIAVAELVEKAEGDKHQILAALLHDVVEDTDVTLEDMFKFLNEHMNKADAIDVILLVDELTDVYTKEDFPFLNRKVRKEMETRRLAGISARAQTIKLADLVDNSISIKEHDYGFAEVYMKEKKHILEVMTKGDHDLYKRAKKQTHK
jgi:(p)ppGpp synthase/HD superfamily hydrolase